MSKNRALTIHFTDTTKLSFIFPQQADENIMAQKVKQLLDNEQLAIEADESLFVIPMSNVKYLQAYPAPSKLPDNVIQGATFLDT
ncbi:hypothetical protein [Thiogranum longum]|jgi:hypothetical protein